MSRFTGHSKLYAILHNDSPRGNDWMLAGTISAKDVAGAEVILNAMIGEGKFGHLPPGSLHLFTMTSAAAGLYGGRATAPK